MKKVTKKEKFMKVIEVLKKANELELVKVMEHEIELIEKKASKSKATKTQTENESIKALILEVLAQTSEPKTITELLKENEQLSLAVGGSNQKLSSLMTQLKNSELVQRTEKGKKALFSLATEEVEEEESEEV